MKMEDMEVLHQKFINKNPLQTLFVPFEFVSGSTTCREQRQASRVPAPMSWMVI